MQRSALLLPGFSSRRQNSPPETIAIADLRPEVPPAAPSVEIMSARETGPEDSTVRPSASLPLVMSRTLVNNCMRSFLYNPHASSTCSPLSTGGRSCRSSTLCVYRNESPSRLRCRQHPNYVTSRTRSHLAGAPAPTLQD